MELPMIETGWLSILPPMIAIVLALMTKEEYMTHGVERVVREAIRATLSPVPSRPIPTLTCGTPPCEIGRAHV